ERVPPALAAEEVDVLVPVGTRSHRQLVAQRVGVHLPGAGRAALAEQLEERVVVQTQNGGALQFKKRVLDGVDVNGVDLAAAGQQVVQGVAAGAGDDDQPVALTQLQGDPVQGGVFPAGVVDQVVPMYRLEDARVDFLPRRGLLHR